MLIAHVEREGVWLVDGGMHTLAAALADACARHGVTLRYRSEAMEIVIDRGRARGVVLTTGERISCDALVVNADAAAVGSGIFGRAAERAVHVPRSLQVTLRRDVGHGGRYQRLCAIAPQRLFL